jgi:hypothetical protein
MANRKFGLIEFTDEQNHAVFLVLTGCSLKIEAPAGSGKTFLLRAGSTALAPKRGVYLAFNKAIADEAKATFPPNVICRTAHSFAFCAVGYKYKDRLQKLTGSVLSDYVHLGNPGIFGTPAGKGNQILDTIRKFCFSSDRIIKAKHVPDLEGQGDIKAAQIDLASYARRVWDKMIDPEETIPITHDVYLKLWSLSNPVLKADFILFDEAQDANAVMLDIVLQQRHCQVIWVGDRYQQIYSWRGAINAMDTIETTHTCGVSQSFRFGDAIAQKANEILNTYINPKIPVNIKGNPGTQSRLAVCPHPDAIICRTNGGVMANIMEAENLSQIHIAGGTKDIQSLLWSAQALKAGKRVTSGTLALFKNWQEVREFAETDSGGDLASIVKMVDRYNVGQLIQILKQTAKTSQGTPQVITTAHKAKGLEWSSVRLFNDFKFPKEQGEILPVEEVNILYVALTRALHTLDITDCIAANPANNPFVLKTIQQAKRAS